MLISSERERKNTFKLYLSSWLPKTLSLTSTMKCFFCARFVIPSMLSWLPLSLFLLFMCSLLWLFSVSPVSLSLCPLCCANRIFTALLQLERHREISENRQKFQTEARGATPKTFAKMNHDLFVYKSMADKFRENDKAMSKRMLEQEERVREVFFFFFLSFSLH